MIIIKSWTSRSKVNNDINKNATSDIDSHICDHMSVSDKTSSRDLEHDG